MSRRTATYDTRTDDWRRYPFQLVPGDPEFVFPRAEAEHPDCESDTWFLAGALTGQRSGRKFAFLTIFNKNRPGGSIVADFYTFALFDLDDGGYGTYTDYDMPPANLRDGAHRKLFTAEGHLDMAYEAGAGTAVWRTRRDAENRLLPYTYEVGLVGCDRSGDAMKLHLHVAPTRAPVPVGASTYNGKFSCFGQDDTYSYFQTGMTLAGTLRWGAVDEPVVGNAGHVDRQWFPLYAGGGGTGGDARARSHEWRTINLDNGVDISIWRQFDRTNHNVLQPFSGATTSSPDRGEEPECAEDIEVSIESYVRWPDAVRPLLPALSAARYMPDRHRITSAALELELTGRPLVPAPAHALPIEYMEGPYWYQGTMRGQQVSGFAFYERSLALYRDWELIDVLTAATANLRPRSDGLVPIIAGLRAFVVAGLRQEAVDYLYTAVGPLVGRLKLGAELEPILADMTDALADA
jgi:predicted secreted hydrolase